MKIVTWDWKEHAPIEDIAEAVTSVSGGLVYIYRVNTGTDQFAVVVNHEPLTEDEVDNMWHGEWGDYE